MADDSGPVINKVTLTPALIFTTFITCFGSSMLYGYNLAVVNLPATFIKCFLGETILSAPPCASRNLTDSNSTKVTTPSPNSEKAVDEDFLYAQISSVFVVAGALGAFSTGWVADYIGRRNGLLFNHSFIILGGILCGIVQISKVWVLLYIGRFLIGINCGITIGLASIYLTEIAPREYRGAIGACHQLAVTIGIVIGYLTTLTHTLNSEKLWPIACGLTAVPALISLFLLPICPESPRFLFLKKNKEDEARKAFIRINSTDDPDIFIGELRDELEVIKSQPVFRFTQIFTQRDLRMPLAIACLIQVMQQLSGINAVVTYSSTMLETAGIGTEDNQYCVVAIGLINVIMTIISLPLLERFGRRTLLLWPTTVLAGSLLILTIMVNLATSESYSEETRRTMGMVSAAFILIYISSFALGLGPVPGLIVSEIFRQGPRGAAYSVSQFIQWTSALIVMFSYPIMNSSMGGYSFLPFLVIVIGTWIFFFFFMPETRGRTFDDIARDLAFGSVVVGKRSVPIQENQIPMFEKPSKEQRPLVQQDNPHV